MDERSEKSMLDLSSSAVLVGTQLPDVRITTSNLDLSFSAGLGGMHEVADECITTSNFDLSSSAVLDGTREVTDECITTSNFGLSGGLDVTDERSETSILDFVARNHFGRHSAPR